MKHYNYPADIVRGWDTGEPVRAVCGYERVMVEGDIPEGDTCPKCIEAAVNAAAVYGRPFQAPTRILSPEEMRAAAKHHGTTWSVYFDPNQKSW